MCPCDVCAREPVPPVRLEDRPVARRGFPVPSGFLMRGLALARVRGSRAQRRAVQHGQGVSFSWRDLLEANWTLHTRPDRSQARLLRADDRSRVAGTDQPEQQRDVQNSHRPETDRTSWARWTRLTRSSRRSRWTLRPRTLRPLRATNPRRAAMAYFPDATARPSRTRSSLRARRA